MVSTTASLLPSASQHAATLSSLPQSSDLASSSLSQLSRSATTVCEEFKFSLDVRDTLLFVEEQQVPITTATVHCQQYHTNRDSMIPIRKMICELESQGVVSKTHSLFNRPLWPMPKPSGEWRLTVGYHGLNEVTPSLSATVADVLELQYELESKAAKWCHH
ncbi:hypothetical protein BTVI_107425 [Pitangus sulphuratus]|nr:hypothetical protein BTVI_107425 [Pitangus sulphuratus]